MSQLSELFKSVSEPHLSKQALEDYHTQLSALYGAMRIEMATLEKAEALHMLDSSLPTDIAKKRAFNGTPLGQRLIELKNYTKGTEKLLSSLKNRMYSQY